MAQLKDTLITGDLRVTGTIYGINNNAADADHTHGNIQKGGTLQTNDVTIATGDKLVITDSSDSHKVARASISFNTSSTTSFLRNDGKWATPANTTYTFTTTGTGNAVTAVTLSGTTVTVNKGATYNNYTHPAYTSRENGLYKITVNETGHVNAVNTVSKKDITDLGVPDSAAFYIDFHSLDAIGQDTDNPWYDLSINVDQSAFNTALQNDSPIYFRDLDRGTL